LASLAQRAEDCGGTVGDIGATDPELLPRKEIFTNVELNTDQAPGYRYKALESQSSITLLELWDPPKGRRMCTQSVVKVIPPEAFVAGSFTVI
jgi:hypothetical protein